MPYSKVAVHNLLAQAQPRRLGWPHTPLRVLNKKRQHTHVNSAFKILAQASVEQPARTQADTQRLLDKAVGLINTADLLAPFDRVTYTAALVIWYVRCREHLCRLTAVRLLTGTFETRRQAIADIPPADRSELLDRLNARYLTIAFNDFANGSCLDELLLCMHGTPMTCFLLPWSLPNTA